MPNKLRPAGRKPKPKPGWAAPYYSSQDPRFLERTVLANVTWPNQSAVPDDHTEPIEQQSHQLSGKSTATSGKSFSGLGRQASEKRSATTSKKPYSRKKK